MATAALPILETNLDLWTEKHTLRSSNGMDPLRMGIEGESLHPVDAAPSRNAHRLFPTFGKERAAKDT